MKTKGACKTLKCQSDLEEAASGDGGVFVLFYATWCPFSQAFLPVFLRSAQGCQTAHAHIAIDDLNEVVEALDIEVYPTVLYFKKGKVVKRLDGVYHRGLDAGRLRGFISSCSNK